MQKHHLPFQKIFFKKLKEKRFTPEELLVISKTIEIKEWRNETKEEILESLKQSEEDFKNGKGIPGEVVLANMKKRIENYPIKALLMLRSSLV